MDLWQLAERQHGVFTFGQAEDLLGTQRKLDGLIARGAVERWLPGTYRVCGVPPSWRMQVSAATLSVPGSLASHRSASILLGVGDFARSRPEIIVERGLRRRRAQKSIVVHETKDLIGADLHQVDGIPCTSLVRTLVDLPAVAHPFKAGDAIDRAARRDDTVLKRVASRHLEVARKGRTGTVALRALLKERGLKGDKVDSSFERKALTLVRSAGFPEPTLQHRVSDGDFVAYIDLAWPEFLVAMECDSIEHHLSVSAFEHDRHRRRRLVALGWKVIEFSYNDVTKRRPMVIRELSCHLPIAG